MKALEGIPGFAERERDLVAIAMLTAVYFAAGKLAGGRYRQNPREDEPVHFRLAQRGCLGLYRSQPQQSLCLRADPVKSCEARTDLVRTPRV